MLPGKYILNAAIMRPPNQMRCIYLMNTALTGSWTSFHCSNGLWVCHRFSFFFLLAEIDENFLFIGDASFCMFMIDYFFKQHLSKFLICKVTTFVDLTITFHQRHLMAGFLSVVFTIVVHLAADSSSDLRYCCRWCFFSFSKISF